MVKVPFTAPNSLRDFIRKVSLGNEIDIPIELNSDSEGLLVRRKDLAMKVYGEYLSIETKETPDNLVIGIPNAKKFIKYLTSIDDELYSLIYLSDGSMDKLYVTGVDNTDVVFEVVLSALSEPDVQPMKLEGFFVDIQLDQSKITAMFEVMKLVNSEECGIVITNDGKISFKVGSQYEDKGEVFITQINELPDFNSRFVTKLEDSYFIKFHQQDVLNTLSVLEKSNQDIVTKFRLKTNGAMVITEECVDFIVHFGFVPYV